MLEITGFTKHGGPLTKRISLAADGSLCSDGSACVMGSGDAQRVRLSDLDALARLIAQLAPEEAIGLGAMRPGLPEQAEIVTKARLETMNGSNTALIARTGDVHRVPPRTARGRADRRRHEGHAGRGRGPDQGAWGASGRR